MTKTVFAIPISRSTYLLSYLVLWHLIIALSIASLTLAAVWKLLALSFITGSFCFYYQRYFALNSPLRVNKILRTASGDWHLHFASERVVSGLTLNRCVVTRLLVILYFDSPYAWPEHSVLIVRDSVDDALFKQLRVYCRDPKVFRQ